jgi:hypothetical protein
MSLYPPPIKNALYFIIIIKIRGLIIDYNNIRRGENKEEENKLNFK